MPISQGLQDAQTAVANRTEEDGGIELGDQPNYECALYKKQWDLASVVRDVYQGTAHMRTKKETYLPKWEVESDDDYDKRADKAKLFNATRRTAEGLTGMVFRVDPVLDDNVPKPTLEHTANIDLEGRSLAVFSKDVFLNGMLDGISFVYVDHPQVPRETRTKSKPQAKAENIRPFWVNVGLRDLINVRWEIRNGAPVLTLVSFRERSHEPVGKFGQREVERYRVLRPGEYELYEKNDKGGFEVVEFGPVSLDYIPLFPFYARRKDYFEGEPPLLDLAYENIGHWELGSERERSRTIAHIPILFLAGFPEDEEIEISSEKALRCSNENAKAEWVVYEGQALGESRQDLKDIEARMAALGLSMLVRETRAAETAEAKTIDKSESDSALATAARALDNCMDNALQAHADFLPKTVKEGGTFKTNRDFHDQEMAPELLTTLSAMVSEGKLSVDTLWAMMKTGEVLPEDFDAELEAERIGQVAL